MHSNQDTNNVQSATFSHPEKITITDGNTGNVISEISLYTMDMVTLHNIRDKTAHPPPFPNIDTNGIVEQQMPSITTSLNFDGSHTLIEVIIITCLGSSFISHAVGFCYSK